MFLLQSLMIQFTKRSVGLFVIPSQLIVTIFPQDSERLIIGPALRLLVTVIRPNDLLVAGEKFEVSITIGHNPVNSSNVAQILDVYFEYLEVYLIPPDSFTVLFGNGKTEVFGELLFLVCSYITYTAWLQISILNSVLHLVWGVTMRPWRI